MNLLAIFHFKEWKESFPVALCLLSQVATGCFSRLCEEIPEELVLVLTVRGSQSIRWSGVQLWKKVIPCQHLFKWDRPGSRHSQPRALKCLVNQPSASQVPPPKGSTSF